eukprot:7391765-Prymnesium_polylepis.3
MISNPWGRVFPMGPRGKGIFPVGWVVHVWRALVFVCSRASDWDRKSRRSTTKEGVLRNEDAGG